MVINGKKVAYKLKDKYYHCAMDITMHFVGGKWKSVVMWYLKNQTLRFTELKKIIPDITEKMLSIQLKALEEDGLIKRQAYGVKPPIKVEYSLTEFGKTLTPALDAVAKWGRTVGETKGKIVEV
jgi:DNA-binding HxlR family transcriptional regulator